MLGAVQALRLSCFAILLWPGLGGAGEVNDGFLRPGTVEEFMRLGGRVRVIAHRGFSGRTPENTLVAVRMAVAEGADMVELDFQASLDGEIVCFHDDTLDRTTNGSGLVSQTPLARLKQLDAGSWFSPRFRDQAHRALREGGDAQRRVDPRVGRDRRSVDDV